MITPLQQQTSIPTQVTNILIDGATGYIGSHVVSQLQQRTPKLNVRCLVRKGTKEENLKFLSQTGAQLLQANMNENGENIQSIFSQIDVACHLIGSIAPKRGETPESIHIEQTKLFVEHCLKSKVGKIVMVSACGADAESEIAYQRTKWQAEQLIINSGIPSIILRPSLVVGKIVGSRNSKLISRLQDLIENKQAVPLVAGGQNKVQPLFIGDLVEAIITAIFTVNGGLYDKAPILELGGPEILTLRELTSHLMKIMGKERSIVDLPAAVAMAVAFSSETLQATPILSRDQVKLSQKDNICSANQLSLLINREPTNIEKALVSYRPK